MRTSKNGIEVMHYYEGCRLLSYPDPGSSMFKAMSRVGVDPYNVTVVPSQFASLSGAPWTIGWGDTGAHVKPGQRITQAEADARFAARLEKEFEPMANRALTRNVSQGEFDGFISALYNTGPGKASVKDGLIVLASGAPSTFLRKLNAGDPTAPDAILAWNRSGGQRMLGLVRRRTSDRCLMLGMSGAEAIAIGAAVVS